MANIDIPVEFFINATIIIGGMSIASYLVWRKKFKQKNVSLLFYQYVFHPITFLKELYVNGPGFLIIALLLLLMLLVNKIIIPIVIEQLQ
ncbi:hypothetical protein [Desulfosediminicola ganghwensis]|uniref:hypothetical protein n=1 Tax=Desulfosediminicola ganghwensis TaxID=2569540 RepID=UPI0010AB739C|nr:hypothetical protein [Desulfosediminicola ganghwensis]